MSAPAQSITFESAGRNGDAVNGNGSPNGTGVCPYYHEAVELIGKRWTGAIVDALLPGPLRFSAIAHSVPQISDRLLSIRLRELEGKGIVARHVLDGAPVRVEYALTSKGRALEPAIGALRDWAREWLRAG
jgi:DNA-binding HxlR family transcriptional regulator